MTAHMFTAGGNTRMFTHDFTLYCKMVMPCTNMLFFRSIEEDRIDT